MTTRHPTSHVLSAHIIHARLDLTLVPWHRWVQRESGVFGVGSPRVRANHPLTPIGPWVVGSARVVGLFHSRRTNWRCVWDGGGIQARGRGPRRRWEGSRPQASSRHQRFTRSSSRPHRTPAALATSTKIRRPCSTTRALAFVEEREPARRQWQQRRLLHLLEHPAHPPFGGAVGAGVGHRHFPVLKVPILVLNAPEHPPLQAVLCT